MDLQKLQSLRAGGEDCPSDLALDRLHAAELSVPETAALRLHITACQDCSARMASREEGFDIAPAVDSRVLLSQLRTRLAAEPKKAARWRWLSRFRYALLPVVAAAAGVAMIGVLRSHRGVALDPEVTRSKGGLTFAVYQWTGSHARQVTSGEHFVTGDRLRFVVDLPSRSRIGVLGVESKGQLYVAWPARPDSRAVRDAGPRQELDGAIVLDDSQGKEVLYLVACPEQVASIADSCHLQASGASLMCPPQCSMTAFVLNKN